MRIGWKRRRNYKLWFYILSSECGHLGYKEDGGSEEPHSMFLFPSPASRLSDGIHTGLSRNCDDKDYLDTQYDQPFDQITIFHVAGLPVLWWELLCQPAWLQWKDNERDVTQVATLPNHSVSDTIIIISGARVLTTKNPSQGIMREMFVEGRGGGVQKGDEKVSTCSLILHIWHWIIWILHHLPRS